MCYVPCVIESTHNDLPAFVPAVKAYSEAGATTHRMPGVALACPVAAADAARAWAVELNGDLLAGSVLVAC